MEKVTSLWVLCYLTGRIASLVELVVNTLLNFGHNRYMGISALSRCVGNMAQCS